MTESNRNKNVERNKEGKWTTQGENKFDSDTARKTAEEHAWSNRRKQLLKRFGKWEEVQENSNNE